MDDELVDVCSLGIGLELEGLRLSHPVLADKQCQRTGKRGLQREFYLDFVGFHALPFSLQLLAGRVFQHDVVDTSGAAGSKMNGLLPARDQRRRIAQAELPRLSVWIHEVKNGSVVLFKSPIAVHGALHIVIQMRCGQSAGADGKATLHRVGFHRKLDCLVILRGQAQRHLMGIVSGEHQRCAFHGQDQIGLGGAQQLLGIDGMQRRHLRLLDGRQRGDQNRFGVMEGRRCVQCQCELVAMQRGQRRNVLILRSAKGVEDSRDIHNRRNVGTVVPIAQLWREARLHGEVPRGARGQRLDDRGAVAIIENQRPLPLHQAARLQLGNAVQALLVHLDCKASGKKRRGFL